MSQREECWGWFLRQRRSTTRVHHNLVTGLKIVSRAELYAANRSVGSTEKEETGWNQGGAKEKKDEDDDSGRVSHGKVAKTSEDKRLETAKERLFPAKEKVPLRGLLTSRSGSTDDGRPALEMLCQTTLPSLCFRRCPVIETHIPTTRLRETIIYVKLLVFFQTQNDTLETNETKMLPKHLALTKLLTAALAL